MDNEDLLSYKLHLVLRFIDENQEGDYVEEESTMLESVGNSIKEEPAKLPDLDKRKLIQQQLILLLHAHKCSQREKTFPDIAPCSLPHCAMMKVVLEHMTTCAQGRQCNYAHCASSRQIICHWKNCSQEDCPVCKPLRDFEASPNSSNALASSDLLPNPDTNLSSPISSTQPMDESEMSPSGLPPMPELSKIESSYQLPPPDPPAHEKEWHQYMTNDLRNHLVGKLVKAVFPSPNPAALHDQRIKDLILYARKVEKEVLEIANDREEYYHLLAEKIYKIQKELQVKKNRRLQQSGDSDRGSGSSEMIFSIKELQEDIQNQGSIMGMNMTGNRSMNDMADMNNPTGYSQNGMNPEMPSNPQMTFSQGMRPMLTNSKPMQMHQQQNNYGQMNPPYQFQQPNHAQMMQQQQGPGSLMGQPNQQDGIFMPGQLYANNQMMPGRQGSGSMMGQPNQQSGIFMPGQLYASNQMMPGQQGPGSMMGQPNQQDGILMPGQSYANNQMMPGQQSAGTQGMRPTGQMLGCCLHLGPYQQQQGMPQQMQQMNNMTPHARNNDQMQKILARFKAATTKEERTILMNELKKTPHLFAAFLKATQNQQNQQAGGQIH